MATAAPFDIEGPLSRGVTLIEASAGTGKTYTITSLMLRLVLEEHLTIDRVLVVTFTEAATAELRDRTRGRFREMLRVFTTEGIEPEDPLMRSLLDRAERAGTVAEDISRLEAALASFDEASISTIHGFCNRVLAEHSLETGTTPDADLLPDEGQLRDEVVRDFFITELHAAPLELVRFLLSKGGGRGHLALDLERLNDLSAKVCAHREMPILPPDRPVIPPPPREREWAETVTAAETMLGEGKALITSVLAGAPLHKQLADKVAEHLEAIASWLGRTGRSMDTAPAALSRLSSRYLATKTKKGGAPPVHPFFDACETLCTLAEEHRLHFEARALDLILRFIPHVRQELVRRKRAKHVRSFDDLLFDLFDALRGPLGERLSEILSKRFDAVLIDEFQDTDPIQYDIFERIFGRGRSYAFLIGDPKQAIYSFRGADIYAYLKAAKTAGERCYTLDTNWRSDERLVEAIEHLMSRVDAPFVETDIDFIQVKAHHEEDRLLFHDGPQPPLCVRFLRVEDAPDGISARTKIERVKRSWLTEQAPALVACEVAEILASGSSIEGRPVDPGDVAVLVRKNEQARQVQVALRELQIPSVLHGAASVFHSSEARDLRHILSAVAEPSSAKKIKAALATETLGYRVSDLVELEQSELAWEAQLDRFRSLHQLWSEQRFIAMARALIDGDELPARLLSRVDGERRLTNLLHLTELLHRQEHEARLGMAGLLRWFDLKLENRSEDAEEAQLRLESDERAVQLVTIHKAKGLQYPIVICPYLWDSMTLHQKDKLYPRFHDPSHDLTLTLDVGSAAHGVHVQRAELEARTEALRLLYVALTRAQHRCILFAGAVDSVESSPLGYLLHAPPGLGDRAEALAAADAACKQRSSASLYEELLGCASKSGQTMEVTPLVMREVEPYQPPSSRWPDLQARRLTRSFDRGWRTASFTSLTTAATSSGPTVEEESFLDEISGKEAPKLALDPPGPATGRSALHAFPRGAEAGTCLHAMLETLDFGIDDEATLRKLVEQQLVVHGFAAERWSEAVTTGLIDVIGTSLEPSDRLALRMIPRERRLNELEFIFPVAQRSGARTIRPSDLAEIIRRHRSEPMPRSYADAVASLGFEPLEGFLKGFIDLVFEHDGKWFVVDYKSNHLGDIYDSYVMEKLVEVMEHHHYFVQYLLYTVALHRYLTWRLPGYDFDRHYGGVYYLFLRGMSPSRGAECGVFVDRPSRELIYELSELLEGGAR